MTGPLLGRTIRARRKRLGRTLAQVAETSGLSAPFLSQVENDRARPSLSSLQVIADALDTTAVELFAGAAQAGQVDVTRATEDTALVPAEAGTTGAVRMLVRGRRQLRALEFADGAYTAREFVHRNDELMYVVHGSIHVVAGGEEYELGEGDALYCAGGVQHNWKPLGENSKVILVSIADDARVSIKSEP